MIFRQKMAFIEIPEFPISGNGFQNGWNGQNFVTWIVMNDKKIPSIVIISLASISLYSVYVIETE